MSVYVSGMCRYIDSLGFLWQRPKRTVRERELFLVAAAPVQELSLMSIGFGGELESDPLTFRMSTAAARRIADTLEFNLAGGQSGFTPSPF